MAEIKTLTTTTYTYRFTYHSLKKNNNSTSVSMKKVGNLSNNDEEQIGVRWFTSQPHQHNNTITLVLFLIHFSDLYENCVD